MFHGRRSFKWNKRVLSCTCYSGQKYKWKRSLYYYVRILIPINRSFLDYVYVARRATTKTINSFRVRRLFASIKRGKKKRKRRARERDCAKNKLQQTRKKKPRQMNWSNKKHVGTYVLETSRSDKYKQLENLGIGVIASVSYVVIGSCWRTHIIHSWFFFFWYKEKLLPVSLSQITAKGIVFFFLFFSSLSALPFFHILRQIDPSFYRTNQKSDWMSKYIYRYISTFIYPFPDTLGNVKKEREQTGISAYILREGPDVCVFIYVYIYMLCIDVSIY